MNPKTLPYYIEINKKKFPIRNKGDYRVILDVLEAMQDNKLSASDKNWCIIYMLFGENTNEIMQFYEQVIPEIQIFLNCGKRKTKENLEIEDAENERKKQPVIDWNKDFELWCPPVNKVLGYDIRTPNRFTHWWTVCGAMSVIDECTYSAVIRIRRKRALGKPLDKGEKEFFENNRDMININNLSEDDMEYLDFGV